MRLAAYAGASTVLAASIVLRAFHERPNFYSASVYLAQSSACRMILLNLLLLSAYGIVRALQKLLYGPLRAIEREQLWDKAWYAVTETALAMTTFRDEVGAWFFVMFICLLAGKIWGWISEARVEALEQQPPANPRLYHIRLTISLLLSEIFDGLMLRYCVVTLIEQPRPGMMVMFAFEFAVLAITSTSTALKYMLAMQEKLIINRQMKTKVEERRQEIRAAREEAQGQAATTSETTGDASNATINMEPEEDIDENEIDVPGWQEKGRWMLFLDLLTDLLKLLVYMCFFTILLMFHGIPIHIIRDVFITARSFLKRISDFLKYRNATRDMNARYPDATLEELARDGTCIICREEMRPWQEPDQQPAGPPGTRRPNRMLLDERQRPKKLPCGHILHFGCLRSWLERQQVCPTCRSSVLAPTTPNNANTNRPQVPGQPPDAAEPNGAHPPNLIRPVIRPNPRRARTLNLGGWRFAWAAGDEREVREALQLANEDDNGPAAQARTGLRGPRDQTVAQNNQLGLLNALEALRSTHGNAAGSSSFQQQIIRMEHQIMQEINSLNLAQDQMLVIRALQQQLVSLRAASTTDAGAAGGSAGTGAVQAQPGFGAPQAVAGQFSPQNVQWRVNGGLPPYQQYQQQILSTVPAQVAFGPDHPDLPQGFTLPQGWTFLPLQRNGVGMEEARRAEHTDHPIVDDVLPQVPQSTSSSLRAEAPPSDPLENRSERSLHVDASTESNPSNHSQPLTMPPISSAQVLNVNTPRSQHSMMNSPSQPSASDPSSNTQPAATVGSTIPDWSDWGTAALAPESTPHMEPATTPDEPTSHMEPTITSDAFTAHTEPATTSDGSPSQVSGNASTDKGKAKAVTVEETSDEGN